MKLIEKLKKKFFREKIPEKKKEVVNLAVAGEFIKQFSNENKLNEKMEYIDKEIKDRIKDVKDCLSELERAQVPANIRESNAIQTKVFGNRNGYISHVNILLKKLEAREGFEKEFNDFSAKSIKNYYAVQYLFGKELKKVTEALQSLSRVFIERKRISDEIKDNKFKRLNAKIWLLQETLKNKGMIKKEIEIIENELKRTEPLSVERKYVELKNSPEYHEAVKKREEAESHVRKAKEEIVEFFSDKKRVLKKANNKKKSWIVQYYIDEPVEALLQDSDFKIVGFAKEVSKEDADGENISVLKGVEAGKLSELRTKYENAIEAMKKAHEKQEIEKQLFNLEDMMFKLGAQKDVLSKKLEELKKKDEVNVDELRKEIENEMTEVSVRLIELEI